MLSTNKLEVNKLIYKQRWLSSGKIIDFFVSLQFQYFLYSFFIIKSFNK